MLVEQLTIEIDENVRSDELDGTDISKWQEIGRAHGEFFEEIRPVTTMVEVKALIDPDLCVEIEAEAIITESGI